MVEPRYRALLIANWEYEDPSGELQPLLGPETDLERMTQALTHADFGLFAPEDVQALANLRRDELGAAITNFAKSSQRDDRLLVYFSGHGVRRDTDGRLGLCGTNTDSANTTFSTCDAGDVKGLLLTARAMSKLLILDCCYAGNVDDKGPDTAVMSRSFDTTANGLWVLASSRSRPSKAAKNPNTPSLFTGELAQAMLDETLTGENGYLNAETIFTRLESLQPQPWKSVSAGGSFYLARRRVTAQPRESDELPNYRDLKVDHVWLTFGADEQGGVSVEGSRGPRAGALELDEDRISAITTLEALVEGVAHIPRSGAQDRNWQEVSNAAWETIGANLARGLQRDLFEDLVPDPEHHGTDRFLQLSMRFDKAARALEHLPWENLCLTAGAPAMAACRGAVVERVVRSPDWQQPSTARDPWLNVGVVNTYPAELSLLGERVSAAVKASHGAALVFDLQGAQASWAQFYESLSHQPHALALLAPFQDVEGHEVGFAQGGGAPDWRSIDEVVDALRTLHLDCLTLTTYTQPPARDARRTIAVAARQIAQAGVGPAVALVHGGAYHDYLMTHGQDPVFSSLLLVALASGKPLAQSVMWARERVLVLADRDGKAAFGVPTLFVPEGRRAKPAMATRKSAHVPGSHEPSRGVPSAKVPT